MIVSSRLSAKKLRRNMDRLIQQLPVQQQGIAWQNLDNAIFSQFLDGIAVIKGGASLALRYPLEQGRTSRDLDATVTDGMNMFIAILKNRLREGVNGFTGSVEPQYRTDSRGMKTGMRPFTVRLLYNGAPFTTIDFEASPDHSGTNSNARPSISADTRKLLDRLGLPMHSPYVADPLDILADKLHAISDPTQHRGRDLADITTILVHEPVLSLVDLRARVRNVELHETAFPHEVRQITPSPDIIEAMSIAFRKSGTPLDFDECLHMTRLLLEQVDEQCRDRWLDSWQDVLDREQAWRAFDPARLDGSPRHGMQPRKPAGSPNSTGGQYDSLQ